MTTTNVPITEADILLSKGNDCLMRYRDNGDVEALEASINYVDQALKLELDQIQLTVAYTLLGMYHLFKWESERDKDSLDTAIDYLSRSVQQNRIRDYYLFEDYYNLSKAYIARYEFDENSSDMNSAIDALENALIIKGDYNPAIVNLGTLYGARWKKNKGNRIDLENACTLLERGIRNDRNDYISRYNYGSLLFQRWEIKPNSSDLSRAKQLLSDSLFLHDSYFSTYYVLCSIANKTDDKSDGARYINTALYLLLSGKADWQALYYDILDMIPSTQPLDRLEYLQSPRKRGGLKEEDIEKVFQSKDVLVLLQFLFSNAQRIKELKFRPILLYYLGGVVSSFRIFKEDFDTRNGDVHSPQEYYYYVRSALSFYDHNMTLIGVDAILGSAIAAVLRQNPSSSEDLYYLGQLYYLQALRTESEHVAEASFDSAKHCFRRCSRFIWAIAMLDIVRKNTWNSKKVNDYINERSSGQLIISKENIDNPSFMDQFIDYIHFNEVFYAAPKYYSSGKGLDPDCVFFKPLWEVYKLTKADLEELSLEVRKYIGETIQKEKAAEQTSELKPLTEEENGMITHELGRFLNVQDKLVVEDLAQEYIRDSKMGREEKETLLRHLFFNGQIDGDQYFTLLKYNEYCASVEDEKLSRNNVVLGLAGAAGIVGAWVFSDRGITGLLATYVAREILKKQIRTGTYEEIKSSLWILMNNEYSDEDLYSIMF